MTDYKIIQAMTTEEFKRYLDDVREHYWKVIPSMNKDLKYGETRAFELKWIPEKLKR